MITGDNTLTACSVAHELQITTKPTLILQISEDKKSGERLQFFFILIVVKPIGYRSMKNKR